MKRFLFFLYTAFVLCLCAVPSAAQLVKFLNFDKNTRLQNGSIYTVRYDLNPSLVNDALYLQMVQHAFGSRFPIPAFTCYMPPFPNCSKEFGLIISANEGTKINLIAYSYLTQTRGIIDSSEYATVYAQTSPVQQDTVRLLQVFPNPARSYITLVLPPPDGTPLVVTMYSVDGREIYRYTAQPRAETVSFDTQYLPNGAYYLRAQSLSEVNTLRFIIQH